MAIDSSRFIRYGGADKCTSEMTKEELEVAANNIVRRAKEKAFPKGRPIIYGEGGRIYKEWPDGFVVDITNRPLIIPNDD